MEGLVFDLVIPLFVCQVLLVVGPIVKALIGAIIHMTVPVLVVLDSLEFTLAAIRREVVTVGTAVRHLVGCEDVLPLLGVSVDILLDLQQLIPINGQQGKFGAKFRLSQVILGQLDWVESYATHSLGEMVEWRLLDARVGLVSPALAPVRGEVRQLVSVVLHACQLFLVRFTCISDASRAEEESLQSDEHSPSLESLRLLGLVIHGL